MSSGGRSKNKVSERERVVVPRVHAQQLGVGEEAELLQRGLLWVVAAFDKRPFLCCVVN